MEQPAPVALWRRINPVDWLMLILAIVSVGLLAWETWWDVSDLQRTWVLRADLAICAVFAVEFTLRWRVSGWRRDFLWRNWYEILGMIPVAHPAVRGFRLFRVIRIVVLLARFGRAADRAVGDAITRRVLGHFTTAIVDTIKRPITIAVLEEVGQVLTRGHYTRNIANALEENQYELRAMIQEKLKEDPQTGRLTRLPFYDEIVQAVIDTAMRVIEQVLHDPRTDELVADLLRENLDQLRGEIRNRAR
jgi:voltage-gated potassium channel